MEATPTVRVPPRYLAWAVVVTSALLVVRWEFGYPVFHSITELFAVTVAIGTFMLTWSARRDIDNHYVLFLGIAYFFTACVDALHMLAYQGVEIFPGQSPTELPTQLWLVGRYLQASALLAAPAFVDRKLRPAVVLGVYLVVTTALVTGVFIGLMPSALPVAGVLTPFKIWSEWVVVAAFVAGLIGLLRRRAAFDRTVLTLLSGSIVASIIAEVAFMLYGTPQATANLVGHLVRIVSYFLLYRAIIVTSVARPFDILFRQLKRTSDALARSELRFRSTFEQATMGIAHISTEGRWLLANHRMAEIAGYPLEQLLELSPSAITYPADRANEGELLDRLLTGEIPEYHIEKRFVRPDGSAVWVALAATLVTTEAGAPAYIAVIVEDISARKHAEERLRRARDLSEALGAIDRAVNSTFDRDEVMRRVASLGTAVIEADAATVWVRTNDAWTTHLVHGRQSFAVGEAHPDARVPYLQECIELQAPLAIEDLDERYPGALPTRSSSRPATSALVVPLQFRSERYGALMFTWHRQAHSFSRTELDFAQKLGASLALAMDNARLYAAERRIADTLQASMLSMDEDVPGVDVAWAYRSATQLTRIGGDFFDTFAIDDRNVGFVVGDVSGKGIEAASLTSIAKSTLRAFAYELAEPAAVAAAANRSIAKQIEEGRFIAGVYGLLDVTTGTMRVVVAGHPLPLTCDAMGCTVQATTHNPPLGVFPDWEFETYDVRLNRGDRVVMFSDGLLDARNGSEFFGEERLRRVVDSLGDADPRLVVDTLMDEARQFAGGAPTDDIAILSFRFAGVDS